MHILALEEYGLRCLLQVALHDAEGPVSAQAIARAEGMVEAPDAEAARIFGEIAEKIVRKLAVLAETSPKIADANITWTTT